MIPDLYTVHSRTVRTLACGLLWLLAGAVAAAAQDRAIPLDPGATYRAPALPERQRDTFRLELEKGGLLSFDVSASHLIAVEPPLETVVSRPGGKVFWVAQAGTLKIVLTSGIPGQPLGAYQLRNSFVAKGEPSMEEIRLPADPPYSCSLVPASLGDPFAGSQGVVVPEAVDEWDCDVVEGDTLASGVLQLESRLGTLHAALFGDRVCGSDTLLGAGILAGLGGILAPVFPGPFRIAVEAAQGFAGPYLLAATLFDPCRQGEQDDHHESWLCATALSEEGAVEGKIGNPQGDDRDQFVFFLEEASEVLLDLGSAAGGWRLQVTDAGGQAVAGTAGGDSWQARLGRGRYFLAVDRPGGGSASYQLTLSTFR